jgi:hypothetical protein
MVSAFLLAMPLVPYAVLQASAPPVRPVFTDPPARPGPSEPACPSGAPWSPDATSADSPLSAAAVRRASKDWEWKPLESPGWKILMAPRVVVRGDAPIDALRTVAAYVEEFRRMLQASLGGEAEGIMFSVRVFEAVPDFRRYAACLGAPNAESLYDPRGSEIVLSIDGTQGAAWLQKTVAHEFTHAYMDRVFRRTGPLWFAEGMAEYFSNFAVRAGRLCPGEVDRRAVLLLRLEAPLPLGRFVRTGREEMYGPGFPALYAQAWSLVHYLFSREDGTIDLLLRGGSPEDLERMETDWRAFLERLEP